MVGGGLFALFVCSCFKDVVWAVVMSMCVSACCFVMFVFVVCLLDRLFVCFIVLLGFV